ncbi:hypothetical protein NPX13_g2085 [Xylaria arbuscula]|uniref:Uncharacterized protein n=1 Tax=Xylaria arbuscula TaxID=114810 RepID=A0A9W8TQQ0_9PEZI|nr:hypothetical protein NPX13_g2085 [Xylaria arbuscula]
MKIQIFTRKWYDFLRDQSQKYTIALSSLGRLGCLPPEIRFMIYDYTISDNSAGRSTEWSRREWARQFKVPRIAHVCRDMRQYVMDRYRLTWYSLTLAQPWERLERSADESTIARAWDKAPFETMSLFGVSPAKRPKFAVSLKGFRAAQVVVNGKLEWNDPFKAPTITKVSTRMLWDPQELPFVKPGNIADWQSNPEELCVDGGIESDSFF